jgi:hypothetical protein
VLLNGSVAHKGIFHAGKLRSNAILRSLLVFVTDCGDRRVSTCPGKRGSKHSGVRIHYFSRCGGSYRVLAVNKANSACEDLHLLGLAVRLGMQRLLG